MSATATRGRVATGLLGGTWPLRPFHPEGFVGMLSADGQQVRVAALACDGDRVVALSLVGFDTSIGVVLSRLWSSTGSACAGAGTYRAPHRRHPAPARPARDAGAVGGRYTRARTAAGASIPIWATEAAGLGATLRPGQLGRVRPPPAELPGASLCAARTVSAPARRASRVAGAMGRVPLAARSCH